ERAPVDALRFGTRVLGRSLALCWRGRRVRGSGGTDDADDPPPEQHAPRAIGEQPEPGELPAAVLRVVGEQSPGRASGGAAGKQQLPGLVLAHPAPWCPTRVADRRRWPRRVRRGRRTSAATARGSASPAAVTPDRWRPAMATELATSARVSAPAACPGKQATTAGARDPAAASCTVSTRTPGTAAANASPSESAPPT